MSLGDALLTFVSVFVAALLAFYLDGLRERRATRSWVSEYLGFWRGMLESSAGERDANETAVRRVEASLNGWLASGACVVPPELLQRLFVADASAPALVAGSDFVTRLFETEVRPLVLGRVVPLEGRDREAVDLYRREFVALFERMRAYGDVLAEIREDLVRLGY